MLLSKVAEEKEGKWVTLELRVCWPSWEGKATQGAMAGWILAHEVWPFFSSVQLQSCRFG